MPHFTVQITEEMLDGTVESKIIGALTEAMVTVYGEELELNGIPLRDNVVVGIFGIPRRRWGVGGSPTNRNSPIVTLNVREPGLVWPTIEDVPARLIESITDAVAQVFGEQIRKDVTVLILGTPRGRSGVGGEVM